MRSCVTLTKIFVIGPRKELLETCANRARHMHMKVMGGRDRERGGSIHHTTANETTLTIELERHKFASSIKESIAAPPRHIFPQRNILAGTYQKDTSSDLACQRPHILPPGPSRGCTRGLAHEGMRKDSIFWNVAILLYARAYVWTHDDRTRIGTYVATTIVHMDQPLHLQNLFPQPFPGK